MTHCQQPDPYTLARSLTLLTQLNEARRVHDREFADALESDLDTHDLRLGYDKTKNLGFNDPISTFDDRNADRIAGRRRRG